MFSRYLSLAILGLPLLFGGCSRQKLLSADYAKRAYLKQQEEIETPSAFPAEDQSADVVVHLKSKSREHWKRQSYESLDRWISRLEKTLEGNQSKLSTLKNAYEALEEEELSFSNQVEKLTEDNNTIRTQLQDVISKNIKNEQTIKLAPPFRVYLVRKGDTLYSIAQKFYKTASAIPDIMNWNRGWIRYPNQIQAGTPLVLFNTLDEGRGNIKVFNFIRQLDELRKEELALKDK